MNMQTYTPKGEKPGEPKTGFNAGWGCPNVDPDPLKSIERPHWHQQSSMREPGTSTQNSQPNTTALLPPQCVSTWCWRDLMKRAKWKYSGLCLLSHLNGCHIVWDKLFVTDWPAYPPWLPSTCASKCSAGKETHCSGRREWSWAR